MVGFAFVLIGAEGMAQFVSNREIQKTVSVSMPYIHELGNAPRRSIYEGFFKECSPCAQGG
jgi:uncharacterized pyridoxamine 5'-phosphate oxidase family protein